VPPSRLRRRASFPGLLLLLLLASGALLGACGEADEGEAELRIHVLAEPQASPRERAVLLEAAERALAEAGGEAGGIAVAVVLAEPAEVVEAGDTAGGSVGGAGVWRSAALAAAARSATEDSGTIALIGPAGRQASFSAPISNAAGMLELAAGPVPEELLRERPGGDGVPERYQPSGIRTLGALGIGREAGEGLTPGLVHELGGAPAAGTYAATVALLDAIDRAPDPLSRESVRTAYLESASSPTPLGPLSVDPVGVAGFG
jgi:hypothetical protein